LLDGFFLAVGEGSILNLDWSVIINSLILGFNVILVIIILAKILHDPVKNFMDERAARIQDDINNARLNREQAMEIKADYNNMMANIEKEREDILSEAYRTALKRSDQILFDTREEAKYLLVKAKDEIKIERENAADEIKMQIIEISSLIASRFVEVSVDRQTQDKYIDEALADWSEQV